MPAWNRRGAGRRGRDSFEGDEYYDTPSQGYVAERGGAWTNPAGKGNAQAWYAQNDEDEDLGAVADELDRLLAAQDGGKRQRRSSRQGRPAAQASQLDDVMEALNRLDSQVKEIGRKTTRDDYDDEYDEPRRSRRSRRRNYNDRFEEVDFYDRDEDEEFDERPRARRAGRKRSARSARALRDDYDDLGRRAGALNGFEESVLDEVHDEIGSLRDALGGLSRRTRDAVGSQNSELKHLAQSVERLRAGNKVGPQADAIRKEVAELKALIGQTNIEGSLQSLEHGYAHILERLDELSRSSLDPNILRGVTSRLNEIEDAFSELPRSEQMAGLQGHVSSIAERMEQLLHSHGQAELEPLRNELREVRDFASKIDVQGVVEGIDDRMKFMSIRLDDLEAMYREQRGLDGRLAAMEERLPEAETISRLQGRLEDIVGMMSEGGNGANAADFSQFDDRFVDITQRLERMEQMSVMPTVKAFGALGTKLEAISGKIDALEKKSARPVNMIDPAALGTSEGQNAEFLLQIQERLDELTDRLNQPQDLVSSTDLDILRQEIGAIRVGLEHAPNAATLEQRISELSQIVKQGVEATDDRRFEELGHKVAALAEQVENAPQQSLNVDELTPYFARLENSIEKTRTEVVEIAQKAAQEAVAQNSPQNSERYDHAISNVQGDLCGLLNATKNRALDNISLAHETAPSIAGFQTNAIAENTFDQPSAAQETLHAAPYEAPSNLVEEPAASFERTPFDGLAAEPQMQDQSAAPSAEESARDRKADFIAAARRAAQAASAEAAQLQQQQPSANGGKTGWMRSMLKRDKSSQPQAGASNEELVLGPEHLMDQNSAAAEQSMFDENRPTARALDAPPKKSRKLIYAAAAIVLCLCTIAIFRLVTSDSNSNRQMAEAPSATLAQNTPVSNQSAASNTEQSLAVDNTAVPSAGIEKTPASQTVVAQSDVKPSEVVPAVQAEPVSNAAIPPAASPEVDIAFAPPAGVSSSFGETKPKASNSFAPSNSSSPQNNIIAALPPEGVGPMALRSAAAAGNPAAEFLVGVKYTEGDGIKPDLRKAASWYQKASEKGLAPAQYRLASLYEKGRGVKLDIAKAKDLYQKAAEAGNAKAMHNLAVIFAEGAGGAPDYASAASWFEAAANYGVKDSLFNLGILYGGGIGVAKNPVASYKWFAIAADQGDPEAAKRRDNVANLMDQATLAQARLSVEQFKLKAPNPSANKVTLDPAWEDASSEPAKNAALKVQAQNAAMVKQAQEKLNYLGFDTGAPDGVMGPRTQSAIRAFQRSLSLPETGRVDKQLIDELNSQAI